LDIPFRISSSFPRLQGGKNHRLHFYPFHLSVQFNNWIRTEIEGAAVYNLGYQSAVSEMRVKKWVTSLGVWLETDCAKIVIEITGKDWNR
jgi:hypothetical protein